MLSAEKIEHNYKIHLAIIEKYISKERQEPILNMINSIGESYLLSPASGKKWHHNAFPGGYIDHVNRVVRYALKQYELYETMGGVIDFTLEELIFSALFHDLGKTGDGTKENYIIQNDKWRQDKLQEMYTYNPDLDFMLIPDRSLFILQKYSIPVSQQEFLGIRLHDGVFDDANKAYYFSNMESSRFKSNLVAILHTADFLASKVEYDLQHKK